MLFVYLLANILLTLFILGSGGLITYWLGKGIGQLINSFREHRQISTLLDESRQLRTSLEEEKELDKIIEAHDLDREQEHNRLKNLIFQPWDE